MLSDKQQEVLIANLRAWTAKENVSKEVASMVTEIALSNPASMDEVHKYCEDHMWSSKLVELYSKFLAFLRDSKKPAANSALKEKLMAMAEELYKIAEAL